MATSIKCPNCAAELDVEHMLSADAEEKLKRQYDQKLQQSLTRLDAERKELTRAQQLLEAQRQQQEDLIREKLTQEKQKLTGELQQQLRKTIASDYENQLQSLRRNMQENETRLNAALQKNWRI